MLPGGRRRFSRIAQLIELLHFQPGLCRRTKTDFGTSWTSQAQAKERYAALALPKRAISFRQPLLSLRIQKLGSWG